MSATIIRLQCIDRTLQPLILPKLTSGGKSDISLEITFDDYWDGYAKTVTFYRDKKLVHHATMSFGAVTIPWAVVYEPGTVYVGVFGVGGFDGSVRTSEVLPLDFEQGSPTGASVVEPIPDIYSQLLQAYATVEGLAAEERARLDELVAGGTAAGSEVVDVRTTTDGLTHTAAGTAVRDQVNRARSLASRLSIYDLDVVREHMGLENLCGVESIAGRITDATATWQYVAKSTPLQVGLYTVVVRDLNIPENGFFAIAASTTGQKYLTITEPGVYTMKVYDDGAAYNPAGVVLLLQMSQDKGMPVGVYNVGGLSIYAGDITSVAVLPEELTGVDKKLSKQVGKNLFDKNSPDIVRERFLNGSGVPTQNEYSSAFYCTGFIPIEPETTYALTDYSIGGACIVFYDAVKTQLSYMSGGTELVPASGIFTTPAGAAYVRLSGNIANIDSNQLEKGSKITTYEAYTEYAPAGDNKRRLDVLDEKLTLPPVEVKKLGTLSTGGNMSIAAPNAKNHNAINFSARVASFSSIIISHGKTEPYCSAYVAIDGTHVHVYAYPNKETKLAAYAHGLKISGYVRVSIHVGDGFAASLKLATASGTFEHAIDWNGSKGDVMVESQGSTLTDCALTYYMDGLRCPVWLFGDSYFDYWPKLLIDWGYSDYYIDGFSGRGSTAALASLQKCLEYATPQRLVWCMGMNDADHVWNSTLDTVKQLCEKHDIELILSTVPNVPERDHNNKNAIVRASGYRYVDMCEAVGADKSVAWIDGLQGGDGVHPTQMGSIALATRALLDVPELQKSSGKMTESGGTGAESSGDMLKKYYDTDNDGIVDGAENAQKLGFKPPEYYLDGLRVLTGNPVRTELIGGRGISAVLDFAPKQAGSGDPSPTNIRPISGWTSAKLTRCGKNLMPRLKEYDSHGVKLTANADGSYTLNGTCSAAAGSPLIIGGISANIILTGTYTLSAGNTAADTSIQIRLDGAFNLPLFEVNQTQTQTFDNTSVSSIAIRIEGGKTYDNVKLKLQLEAGSTATEYAPYSNTYAAEFGQTVYGGTLDWQTGVLTVEWATMTINSASASVWAYVTDYGSVSRFNLVYNEVQPGSGIVCDKFATVGIGTINSEGIAVHGSFKQIVLQIKTDRLASKDVAGLSAWLTANPLQAAYKLATPTTIQLTPQEMIEALDGLNTVYSNASGMTVTANHDQFTRLLWNKSIG